MSENAVVYLLTNSRSRVVNICLYVKAKALVLYAVLFSVVWAKGDTFKLKSCVLYFPKRFANLCLTINPLCCTNFVLSVLAVHFSIYMNVLRVYLPIHVQSSTYRYEPAMQNFIIHSVRP